MSLAERLLRTSVDVTNPRDPVLAEWWGGRSNTAAGISVTPERAMNLTAVFAAVGIISDLIGTVPLVMYRRLPNGGKEPAYNHQLYPILHDQPNRWQTSVEFRTMLQGHLSLRGDGYAEIISTSGKPVSELWPLHPDRVEPFRAPDGTIAYNHTPEDGPSRILLQDEMLHIRGLSLDGLTGLSTIGEAKETIGLSMATEEFGSRFFGNGTVLSGVLQHPGELGDKAHARLMDSWEDRHGGVSRSNRPAILEEGMEWKALGVKPEEAQFLETRKYQVTEIARLFRIPPHLMGDVERSTSWGTGIEQQNIGLIQFTAMPWMVRWEQAIRRDLFTTEGKRKYFVQHKIQGLLRGDSKARKEYYTGMFGIGALSTNDILDLENMNPVEGGDQRFVPLNMVPLDQAGEQDEGDTERTVRAIQRVARKEVGSVASALRKHGIGDAFREWANGFYEKHASFMVEVLAIELDKAQSYTDFATTELIEIVGDKAPDALDQWGAKRADKLKRLL